MSKYNNVIGYFTSVAWAIEAGKLDEIINLGNRILAGNTKVDFPEYEAAKVRMVGSTAVVPVEGTITHKVNLMTAISGGTSTEMLRDTILRLGDDRRVKNIVLNVNSPGGTVPGVELVAKAIREVREKKNVVAVANEQMCSAAYWIASAANKIYLASPTAEIGSIGILMAHQRSDDGTITVIRSAPLKAPGAYGTALDVAGTNELQRRINITNNSFITAVSINRQISMEKATEMADGRVHSGEDAIRLGFADGEKTLDEVISELESLEGEALMTAAKGLAQAAHAAVTTGTALAKAVESLKERVASLESVTEALEAEKAALVEQDRRHRAEALVSEFEDRIAPQTKAAWVEDVMELGEDRVRGILERMPAQVPVGEAKLDVVSAEDMDDAGSDVLVAVNADEASIYEQMGLKFIRKF